MRSLIALASVLTLAMLTGCGTLSTVKTREIPEVPADLQICFDQKVRVPGKRGTPLNQEQIAQLVTALWASDANKTRCGKRLLAFLNNLKSEAGK